MCIQHSQNEKYRGGIHNNQAAKCHILFTKRRNEVLAVILLLVRTVMTAKILTQRLI